jgi:hypothetical protein
MLGRRGEEKAEEVGGEEKDRVESGKTGVK